jgi:ribosomal protein S18 acetylase RimI-like enzyme
MDRLVRTARAPDRRSAASKERRIMSDASPAPHVRVARASDLAELHDIFALAFSTHLGRPIEAFRERKLIETRWRTDPESVIVAEADGRLVGSNVVTIWGRFGWFGPLSVHPDYWNNGIAKALMVPTMERFAQHRTATEGLFTFPSSPKHVALYQRYEFWPRRLTVTLSRPSERVPAASFERFSTLDSPRRAAVLEDVRSLCAPVFGGLDPTREVEAVAVQRLGETLVLRSEAGELAAFAIAHHGADSEAGSAGLSVKFGAARDAAAYERLLDAVISYGDACGIEAVTVAVNAAREGAYRATIARGFRIGMIGVAMVRGTAADDPDAWLIEDLR